MEDRGYVGRKPGERTLIYYTGACFYELDVEVRLDSFSMLASLKLPFWAGLDLQVARF